MVDGHAVNDDGSATVESIMYADLTHDGVEEAIVMTRCDRGTSTALHAVVYVLGDAGDVTLAMRTYPLGGVSYWNVVDVQVNPADAFPLVLVYHEGDEPERRVALKLDPLGYWSLYDGS